MSGASSVSTFSVCPNCNARSAGGLLCEKCGSPLEPNHEWTYFDLVGLPNSFQLDSSKLTKAYRSAARAVHPDRFMHASEANRELATRLSAMLNQAYNVLREPVSRADYMLNLAGGPSAAELREVPGALLGDVMTMREEIQTAQSVGDEAALAMLRENVRKRRAANMDDLLALASRLPALAEAGRRDLRKILNAIRYFENLTAELAVDPFTRQALRAEVHLGDSLLRSE